MLIQFLNRRCEKNTRWHADLRSSYAEAFGCFDILADIALDQSRLDLAAADYATAKAAIAARREATWNRVNIALATIDLLEGNGKVVITQYVSTNLDYDYSCI